MDNTANALEVIAALRAGADLCPVCGAELARKACPDCADEWLFDPSYCATCQDTGRVLACPNQAAHGKDG